MGCCASVVNDGKAQPMSALISGPPRGLEDALESEWKTAIPGLAGFRRSSDNASPRCWKHTRTYEKCRLADINSFTPHPPPDLPFQPITYPFSSTRTSLEEEGFLVSREIEKAHGMDVSPFRGPVADRPRGSGNGFYRGSAGDDLGVLFPDLGQDCRPVFDYCSHHLDT
jgi:hypothetical protein